MIRGGDWFHAQKLLLRTALTARDGLPTPMQTAVATRGGGFED